MLDPLTAPSEPSFIEYTQQPPCKGCTLRWRPDSEACIAGDTWLPLGPNPSVHVLQDELSGADIKAMCTEAGLLALRERRMRVTQADFKKSRDKVPPLLHHYAVDYSCMRITHADFKGSRDKTLLLLPGTKSLLLLRGLSAAAAAAWSHYQVLMRSRRLLHLVAEVACHQPIAAQTGYAAVPSAVCT